MQINEVRSGQPHPGSPVIEFPKRGESAETPSSISIRPFQKNDIHMVVAIAQRNFRTTYPFAPDEVIQGYVAANTKEELLEAVEQVDGREASVAVTPSGKVVGFILLGYNPYTRRSPHGELAIPRLHVDTSTQKQGVGKKLFEWAERRGEEIMVTSLFSQSSGSSRPFFELNGWTGRTELSHMKKRRTSAIIWACRKPLGPQEITLYPRTSHVIYAGNSEAKAAGLQRIVTEIDDSIAFMSAPSEEPDVNDPFESARAKAYSIPIKQNGATPLIVAGDVVTELMCTDRTNHHKTDKLIPKGKPKGTTLAVMDEVLENFKMLHNTARRTGKPAPYVVRTVTYMRDPQNPRLDSWAEYDISVFLSQKALGELSTRRGLNKYREEVIDTYRVDLNQMCAGFALPVFLKRGYVVGLNGHPLDTLPHREEFTKKALNTVLVGIDSEAVAQRLGRIR